MTAISYHHFLISFRCLSWLSETKGNTSFLLQDWKHVLWQLNHHVHITECIFMPFVSLHNHLPLYTKIEFFFFLACLGSIWSCTGQWMLVTPLPCLFKTSLTLRAAVTWGPCFATLAVPNQFRYRVWGQELSYLSLHTHHRLLTEEGILSGLLLCSENRWSPTEIPYTLAT